MDTVRDASELTSSKIVATCQALFETRKAGTEEYCCVCLKLMGFPQTLHFEHPARFRDGARYIGNGSGQVCPDC
jgi:hypothetical protein